ncbi:MAG TPA: carbohydrate ABC transporter permease [Anaerolineaceae bacterium]
MAAITPKITKSDTFLGIRRPVWVKIARILVTLLILVVGILTIVPFIWTISTSFKREIDVFTFPIQWIPATPTILAYERVLGVGSLISASRSVPFWRAYLNSIFVTLPGVLGPLITSTLAGYAFARLRFPGKRYIFLLYLGTMIIPEQVLMVPRFMIANWLHLYNTHWSLILPYLITAYGVFMIRQACLTIPQDLFDAAQIDGAGQLQRIWTVVVPSIGPQLSALALILFIWRWNDYGMPLIMISKSQLFTVPLTLAAFIETHSEVNYPAIMAATVLATIPLMILFLFINRYFVQSVVSSGVKG